MKKKSQINNCLGLILILLLISCDLGGLSPTSEVFTYRGVINREGTGSSLRLNIWAANRDEQMFGSSGRRALDEPQHLNSDNTFVVSVFSNTHSSSITVHHWECGPLRILIEGDSIQTYFDSLSNDQLKTLQQNSDGEWVLPTITLKKK